MNNKGADQTARMLFAYGINQFSHGMAHVHLFINMKILTGSMKENKHKISIIPNKFIVIIMDNS